MASEANRADEGAKSVLCGEDDEVRRRRCARLGIFEREELVAEEAKSVADLGLAISPQRRRGHDAKQA